jgi:hypothetical protein
VKINSPDKKHSITGFSVRSRRFFKFRRWIWVSLAVLIVLVGSWWLIHDRFLTIKHVDVIQQVEVQPKVVPMAAIQKSLESQQGKWLWLNTTSLSQRMLQQFPSLASVQIISHFPDKLEVDLLPRVPLCQLITPSGVFLVDRQGFIFARLDTMADHLLQLKISSQPEIGKRLSTNGLKLGLVLITTLRTTSPALQQINLHDGQLDVQFEGRLLVMVADTQKSEVVLPQLLALLHDFVTQNKLPVEVDMRYDRPVLRY